MYHASHRGIASRLAFLFCPASYIDPWQEVHRKDFRWAWVIILSVIKI